MAQGRPKSATGNLLFLLADATLGSGLDDTLRILLKEEPLLDEPVRGLGYTAHVSPVISGHGS